MDEFEIIGWILVAIVIVVGTLIYCSSPSLHNCGSCGNFMTMKQNRYWYQVDGKDVPFCTKCHNKRVNPPKPRTPRISGALRMPRKPRF